MNDTPQTAEPSEETNTDDGAAGGALAQRGGIVVALVVLLVAIFYAFAAIDDVIGLWLADRWVPVWRAVFAIGVAGLAVWVIVRLTRRP